MQFYEDGVMRTLIDTPEKSRFRISEEDLPVEWDQLKPVSKFEDKFYQWKDGLKVVGIARGDGD